MKKDKKENCKLISLDTSSTDTGYAVFLNGKLKRYGDFDHKKDADKMNKMCKDIYSLIKKEDPDIIVVEDLNVMKSVKTAKMLAEIIGATRVCQFISRKKVFFYKMPPKHWRKLIGDNGPRKRDDCKLWDIQKLLELYKISTLNDNIADAILIGRAYIEEFG